MLSKKNYEFIVKAFSIVGYFMFFVVTVYLVYTGKQFSYYAEFSAATTGSGIIGTFLHKYIESKYNSPPGQPPGN